MSLSRAGDGGHSGDSGERSSESGGGGRPGPGQGDALGSPEVSTNWTDSELESGRGSKS